MSSLLGLCMYYRDIWTHWVFCSRYADELSAKTRKMLSYGGLVYSKHRGKYARTGNDVYATTMRLLVPQFCCDRGWNDNKLGDLVEGCLFLGDVHLRREDERGIVYHHILTSQVPKLAPVSQLVGPWRLMGRSNY